MPPSQPQPMSLAQLPTRHSATLHEALCLQNCGRLREEGSWRPAAALHRRRPPAAGPPSMRMRSHFAASFLTRAPIATGEFRRYKKTNQGRASGQ